MRPEWVRGYGIAVAASGLMLLCALAISPPGELSALTIPMFLGAVIWSAWFGGRGPGLVATAIGFLAIDYFFEDPAYSLAITSVSTAIDLAGFVVCAVLIGTLSARSRTALPAEATQSGRAREIANGVAQTPANVTQLRARQSVVKGKEAETGERTGPVHAPENPSTERTFVILKPDGLERGLLSEVIGRFERRGLRLRALKTMQADRQLIEQHYAHHRHESFFNEVIDYMLSGPVAAMVLEGTDAVRLARTLIGSPHPDQATPGTIRGDFAVSRLQTLVHSADTHAAADRELALWFGPGELDVRLAAAPQPLVARAS